MAELRLVVGVDGSAEAREAVRWASRLTSTLGGEIVVVHALGLLEHLEGNLVVAHRHRAEIEQVLENEWSAPLGRDGTPVQTIVQDGHPVDVLLGVAESIDADLLVMGNRGSGASPDLALGSTSLHVLRAAEVPVLVVPERESSARHLGLRRILAATDGTPASEAAVEIACGLAEAFGAWITAAHAVEDHATSFHRNGNAELHERVHRSASGPAHIAVRRGRPDEVIRTVATMIDADLVVTGCRHHRAGEGRVVGSVSRQVVRAVHRPTLVVPERYPARSLGRPEPAPAGAS
jgi:uncharacterized protein